MKGTDQHATAAARSSIYSATPAAAAATDENGTFGFPYVPYPSQMRFMATLWTALQGSGEKTKFAALELPTGGGKTLSFLCPSVLWLKQQEEQLLLQQLQQPQQQMQAQQKQQQDSPPTRKMPAWVKTALLQQQRQQAQQFLAERSKRLKEAAARADVAAAAAGSANPVQQLDQQKDRDYKVPVGSKRHSGTNSMQEQQWLADYDAFAPDEPGPSVGLDRTSSSLGSVDVSSQQGSIDRLRKPQIVICSRTHQQLKQYVGEIRLMQKHGRRHEIKDFVAVVAAGRQQLCLHPDVCNGISNTSNSSNSSSDLGDKCSYLVSKGLCSYYKKRHVVSDAAVAATLDIEDLRRVGRSVGGCPYFGCREAVAEADVVLLPFSLAFPADGDLAEKGAVSLQDSVFCVDEAHHLSAALSSSKSAALSHQTAASAVRLLSLYVKCFSSRLAPRSLHLIQQLLRLVETIYKRLQPLCCCAQQQHSTGKQQQPHHHAADVSYAGPLAVSARCVAEARADTTAAAVGATAADTPTRGAGTVLTATESLRLFKLENFDLHELIAFLADPNRRICQKLRGFAMHHNHKLQQPQQKQQQTKWPESPKQNWQQHNTENQILEPSCLYTVKTFLCSLLSMDAADRLIITSLHQHPAAPASTIVGPPGGADRKGIGGEEAKLIPGSACCCCRLQSFLAVAGVGGGVDSDTAAAAAPIVEELKRRGPIFAERRTPGPTKTDAGIRIAYGAALWQLYSSAVLGDETAGGMPDTESIHCTINLNSVCADRRKQGTHWHDERYRGTSAEAGAKKSKTVFLLCVMGGRLSEGVNFSNTLARLVVVVGMPFPSIKDTIFILHKQHYNEIMVEQTATADVADEAQRNPACRSSVDRQLQQQQKGQQCVDYGLLQCMIAVNQTIGRAIRHTKDYAAILLVDRRYSLDHVQRLLPRWLLQSLYMAIPAEDEKWRAHPSLPPVSCGADDAGEAIYRRLQLFFDRLEKAELEAPK